MISTRGVVNRIVWAADDGSWVIANLKNGDTVVGPASRDALVSGMEYDFAGKWKTHPQYGKQFEFSQFIARTPMTTAGVMSYLNRYLFGTNCGIGEAKAHRLIAELGAEHCLDVMRTDPQRVAAVASISIAKAKQAQATLQRYAKEEQVRVELAKLFHGRGFNQKLTEKLVSEFGLMAAKKVASDPYTMLVRRMPSAGFDRCDKLYRDLGLPQNKLKRQMVCIWSLINKANGSVWLKVDDVVSDLRRMVLSEISPERAVRGGTLAGLFTVLTDGDGVEWIANASDAGAEQGIWNAVGAILNG